MPPRSQRTPDASAAGRLQRLLALVPWVMSRPDATVEEVCARFSITREALMADLELLFVSGVPPYGPGDLIEAWVDGDRVHIGLADYFARAPRLTWREAAGLYLAGRALASLPEVDQQGALTRALAKLEAVLPADQLRRVQELGSRVSVELDGDPVERERRAALAKAAAASRRVVIEYYTGSRGELTRRKVDPWLVYAASGHWYLTGWCHRARGERLFRVDRVVSVEQTDEPFDRPADFDSAAYGDPARGVVDGGLECELDLGAEAEWFADYVPILASERRPDGRLRVRLAVRELSWIVRFVLRLAPDAEPVGPPQLRAAVAAAARDAHARYGPATAAQAAPEGGTSRA
jgi:predicted DNA-binding transcriptional regulator YafY